MENRQFISGAKRNNDNGKPKPLYLPFDVLMRVARHYEKGSSKFGNHNWRKGIPSTEYFNSMTRHISQYWEGKQDEDHLSAIVFNAIGIMLNEEKFKDDEKIHDMISHWKDL